MKKKQAKNFKIILENKPPRKGHQEHLSGSGQMDNRPKRLRTRQTIKKNWEKEI